MFDIGGWELLVIGALALIVVGPKDLPRLVRQVGLWVGKARKLAREFQSGMEEVAREAELDELKKVSTDLDRDMRQLNSETKRSLNAQAASGQAAQSRSASAGGAGRQTTGASAAASAGGATPGAAAANAAPQSASLGEASSGAARRMAGFEPGAPARANSATTRANGAASEASTRRSALDDVESDEDLLDGFERAVRSRDYATRSGDDG